ncbi:MAG: multiple sugar transport system permease protein [Actinomycetota bacterium]|nr:multiple sugar transport system permease protein [Actinomycetota bacterium]
MRIGAVPRAEARAGLLLVSPFAVLLAAFLLLPLAYALWMSLHRSTLVTGSVFAGADNYLQALRDPEFARGAGRVVLYGLVQTPILIGLALFAALVTDATVSRVSKMFRMAMFAPYAVPGVIGALMWGFLYSPSLGPLTGAAEAIGLGRPDFTGKDLVFASIVNVSTWQWVGYNMIVLYSALQAVPGDLCEAATIDGAGAVRIAVRIKTPMIRSAIVMATVFTVIGTLQLFVEPFMLQPFNPGTITDSYVPNLYAYSQAFSYQRYEYSAALSFALGAIVFVCSYAFLLVTRRRSVTR